MSISTPNVCEMMRAIRGHPNRGLRDLSSTMARMRASLGPGGPGFFGRWFDENNRRYLRRTNAWWNVRRRAQTDGDLPDPPGTQKQRPESAQEPVVHRQVRSTPARAAQHDQLLLEQEILSDHGSHAAGSTQPRGRDSQVEQDEQDSFHTRDRVGQTSGALHCCSVSGFNERIGNSRRTGSAPTPTPSGAEAVWAAPTPSSAIVPDAPGAGTVLGLVGLVGLSHPAMTSARPHSQTKYWPRV